MAFKFDIIELKGSDVTIKLRFTNHIEGEGSLLLLAITYLEPKKRHTNELYERIQNYRCFLRFVVETSILNIAIYSSRFRVIIVAHFAARTLSRF